MLRKGNYIEFVWFQRRLMENRVLLCLSVLLPTLSVVRELVSVLPLDTWMELVVLTVCIVSHFILIRHIKCYILSLQIVVLETKQSRLLEINHILS